MALKDQEPTPRLTMVSSFLSDTTAKEGKDKAIFCFINHTFFSSVCMHPILFFCPCPENRAVPMLALPAMSAREDALIGCKGFSKGSII